MLKLNKYLNITLNIFLIMHLNHNRKKLETCLGDGACELVLPKKGNMPFITYFFEK
jgi:hypothetical protein